MAVELLMPALSPTMKEGTLAKWNKKEGDRVKIGEIIAEIETDKAVMEFEAIDEGVIGRILIPERTENVAVNALIAVLLEEGEDLTVIDQILSSRGKASGASVKESSKNEVEKHTQVSDKKEHNDKVEKIFISPLAKRLAEQNAIDINSINGSGPRGRIVKSDIESAMERVPQGGPLKAAIVDTIMYGRNSEEYTKVPNNNMRKVIARRLVESKREIPHFYLEVECEMDQLLELRKQLNSSNAESPELKISVNDLIIKASALSLKKIPEANASWTEEAVLKYNNVDISIAVAIEGGLITPIIKNADQKPIGVISEQMKDLASRARKSALKPEEFQGGSFTISNLGMFGVDSFKAIINPPQSCILAIGSTSEKATVKDGKIVIASIMRVTLSADHRVIDGAVGAKFLTKFKEYIEHPVTMLMY